MRPVRPTPEQVRAALAVYESPRYRLLYPWDESQSAKIIEMNSHRVIAVWATGSHDQTGQDEAARIVLRLLQGREGT